MLAVEGRCLWDGMLVENEQGKKVEKFQVKRNKEDLKGNRIEQPHLGFYSLLPTVPSIAVHTY